MQIRHFAPPAFIAYLGVGALLGLRRPGKALAMVTPYAAALAVASVRTQRKLTQPEDRIHVPMAFVAMHIGWGAGFCSGIAAAAKQTVSRKQPSIR
jgi:succinoglycan biosynthesis protein ExoA